MGNSGELWAVSLRIVIQLEERDCQELHVLGYCEDFWFRKGSAMECKATVMSYLLVGGRVTRKSFLHSFGLVM